MNKLICHLAVVLVAVGLTGCGLKGPLYYPSQGQKKAAMAQQSAPQHHDASARTESQKNK